MTPEEAIKWFKDSAFYHTGHDPFNTAIEALNKQVPKKPRSKTRHGTKQQTPQVLHWCSSCITMLHGKPHYCSHCGQAIKWD